MTGTTIRRGNVVDKEDIWKTANGCENVILDMTTTEKVTNTEVLERVAVNEKLWSIVKKKKIAYFGHIIRWEEYRILQTI